MLYWGLMSTPRFLIKLSILVVLAGLLLFGWTQAQAIEDWIKLRGYQPPAHIAALAANTTMSDEAEHIFYVNRPELIGDISKFRKDCPFSEQSIVLGCYHSDQNGIDLYDVKDERLEGVEEVTAAHEMLHAAYDRLSDKERDRIDAMLESYYKNSLTDERVRSTIELYKTTEPNDVVNEMHSIFGTEIASLPLPLENYYKQYFASRAAVVGFAQNYAGEFTRRTAQIDEYDARLSRLKGDIEEQERSLAAQLDSINSDRTRLDQLRDSGRIEEYNSGVASFNAKIDAYNSGVRRLQSMIAEYNELVATRNLLAAEVQELEKSLDTRLQPQSVR